MTRLPALIVLMAMGLAACWEMGPIGSKSGGDADTDADADSDADADADGPGDPACPMLWAGECLELLNGCANCPDGAVSTPVHADCPDGTWCCAPSQPPQNPCETAGGICVEAGETADPSCPPGWAPSDDPCDEDDACCAPTAECADA